MVTPGTDMVMAVDGLVRSIIALHTEDLIMVDTMAGIMITTVTIADITATAMVTTAEQTDRLPVMVMVADQTEDLVLCHLSIITQVPDGRGIIVCIVTRMA